MARRPTKPAAPAAPSATPARPPVRAPKQGPLGQVFGVRHLSPMGAWHLARFIAQVEPTCILIEGPADATPRIPDLAHELTRPPVAILAYHRPPPPKAASAEPQARTRSILFPLAAYSPEWIALREGLARGCDVRFMDLPAAVFLGLEAQAERERAEAPQEHAPPAPAEADASVAYANDPYGAIARLSGDPDHDTWWERAFEHNTNESAYREAVHEFGLQLRSLREGKDARERENLLREAYMRRSLRDALARGHSPERIVVVCGAFHSTALVAELPAMTDKELAALPQLETKLTVMPYSYPRLSSQSGYGAGNHAPRYFELLFEELRAGHPERLSARYLTELAQQLRKQGNVRSSAEVMEAVRLAEGMASLHGEAHAPTLRDLRDAAVTCLAGGYEEVLKDARQEVELGFAIGKLPPGAQRTGLQDDFYNAVANLKLTEYLKDKKQRLQGSLDNRSGSFIRIKEGLGRAQSIFLHRTRALALGFATFAGENAGAGKSAVGEAWDLQWSPTSELTLVEQSLLGDSVEEAAANRFKQQLEKAEKVGDAAQLASEAVLCDLEAAMRAALERVQALAVDDHGFLSIARGLDQLGRIVRRGDVRKVDVGALEPLVAQLFLRATVLVAAAARCDDEAAREVGKALANVQWVANFEDWSGSLLATDRWYAVLDAISDTDSDNPYVSGVASAILLERGMLSDEVLERRVALRVSPGAEPGGVAGFFEGLVSRNRLALLARKALWRSLDAYVQTLDTAEFRRAVVGLRRAFSTFTMSEVRAVTELLVGLWGGEGKELASAVEVKVDQAELDKLSTELEGLDLDLDL